MASQIDICKFALLQLGKKPIASLDDATAAAEACLALWDTARDSVLSDHPWNFATTTIELSQIADADYPDYDYAYQYPSDCLRALELVSDATEDELPYEVRLSSAGTGLVILCDYETATLKYISRVENCELFSPLFSQALGYQMAALLSQSLTGAADKMRDLVAMYERVIAKAAARDCQEGRQGPREDNPYIDSRA